MPKLTNKPTGQTIKIGGSTLQIMNPPVVDRRPGLNIDPTFPRQAKIKVYPRSK
jgi:hypothetical protein